MARRIIALRHKLAGGLVKILETVGNVASGEGLRAVNSQIAETRNPRKRRAIAPRAYANLLVGRDLDSRQGRDLNRPPTAKEVRLCPQV
jgi:hypothetical protein